jgi:molybdopterin adenylyltransferase
MRIAILTISDACSRGERADTSGDAIAHWAELRGDVVAARELVPDLNGEIVRWLVQWCDGDKADLVLTTGGTGLSPTDVTPEATKVVIERDAPGIPELMRVRALDRFPRAALSRGVAGTRSRTLIVNLPGSPGGVSDALQALDTIVDHAVAILRGEPTDHSAGSGRRAEGGATADAPPRPRRSPDPLTRVPRTRRPRR